MRGLALATLFLGLCLFEEKDTDMGTIMRIAVFVLAMIAILLGI
jgi:hypothetical protein